MIKEKVILDPMRLKRQFVRAAISSRDFEEAQSYLQSIPLDSSFEMKRGLLTAAVVAYCRPFTDNGQGTEEQASGKLMGNFERVLAPPQYVLHNKIWALRNTAVAHADYEAYPLTIHDLSEPGYITRMPAFDLTSEVGSVADFISLCIVMKRYCVNLAFKLKDQILLLN